MIAAVTRLMMLEDGRLMIDGRCYMLDDEAADEPQDHQQAAEEVKPQSFPLEIVQLLDNSQQQDLGKKVEHKT